MPRSSRRWVRRAESLKSSSMGNRPPRSRSTRIKQRPFLQIPINSHDLAEKISDLAADPEKARQFGEAEASASKRRLPGPQLQIRRLSFTTGSSQALIHNLNDQLRKVRIDGKQ
jgi:hypothetical protein